MHMCTFLPHGSKGKGWTSQRDSAFPAHYYNVNHAPPAVWTVPSLPFTGHYWNRTKLIFTEAYISLSNVCACVCVCFLSCFISQISVRECTHSLFSSTPFWKRWDRRDYNECFSKYRRSLYASTILSLLSLNSSHYCKGKAMMIKGKNGVLTLFDGLVLELPLNYKKIAPASFACCECSYVI